MVNRSHRSEGNLVSIKGIGYVEKYFRTHPLFRERTSWSLWRALLPLVAGLAFALGMTGCAVTGSKADPSSLTPVISVAITQAPLAFSTVIVGNAVPLSAVVGNDPANAGVDWVASCGSAPLCGSFSPSHTTSGGTTIFTAPSEVPTQGTITITALSATNHGEQSAAFLTIVSSVTSISIIQPPPAFVPADVTITLAATVVGDPANLGVDWTATCGTTGVQRTPVNCTPSGLHSLAGGSTTFTVPGPQQIPNIVGTTITITARPTADHSFSASASFTVTASPTITLTQIPPSSMLTNATATVAAVVAGDTTNSGVTWSVSCDSSPCGSISPTSTTSGGTATFTAPSTVSSPNLVVVITASSTSVGPLVSATASVTIVAPLTVTITKKVPTGSIHEGSSAPLVATVTNDPGNGGVNWTVSCGSPGACGTFSATSTASGAATTFTAPSSVPAGNTVTITATSTDSTQSDNEVVTVTAGVSPDSLLLGNFVILLSGKHSSNGPYALGGLISGDGLGNITSGGVDLVDASGNAFPSTEVPISSSSTSTYSIGPDGRGQINLMLNTGLLSNFGVNGTGAITLSVVFVTSQHALLTEMDSFGSGTGTLDLQNATTLGQSGTYSLALSGVEASFPYPDYSVASAMTIDFSASSYSYITDQSDQGKITSVPFTTTSHNFSATQNQGELSFTSLILGLPTQFNLDAWIIDANHLVVMDWRDSFSGSPNVIVSGYLTAQPSSPTVSGTYAFTEAGATTAAQPQVAGGILTCGSTGTLDVTLSPSSGTAVTNAPVSATCTAPVNGRGLIAISGATTAGISQFAAYPTLDQGLILVELDGGLNGTLGPSGAGVARQQTLVAPIPASALSGNYASNFTAQTPLGLESFVGQIVSDGISILSGTADVNSFNAPTPSSGVAAPSSNASLTGSFTAAADGSGRFPLTLNFSPATGQPAPEFNNINPACYIVDANTCLLLGLDVNAPGTGIVQLQNTGL
jgi:hypothetical protein